MSNEITKIAPIVSKAQGLEIKDSKTLEIASDFRSALKKEEKRLKEDKDKIMKPLNQSIKEIRAKYKPAEDIIEKAITLLNSKMSEYQMALIIKQRKEEEKIANRIGEGKGKLSMETASRKIGELATIETPTSTGFRSSYVLEITKEKDIPREYLIVNEASVLQDLKKGIEIPGARLKEVLIPVNK